MSFRSLVLAGMVLVFSVGCGTTSSLRVEFDRAVMAKDVDVKREGKTSRPVDTTDTFTTEDATAVMWVKLRDIEGPHTLRWEWYDPQGRLYYTTDDYRINRDGRLRRFHIAWHRIAIKGDKAETLPGIWTVKVFLDGKVVATRSFEIKKPLTIHERILAMADRRGVEVDRHRWALIIGIERYRKTSPALYAENDAQVMKELFTRILGVPVENTIVLLNDMATKAELELLIKDRLKGLLKEGDTLYVYYSGHGIPSPDATPYLLPYDGDVENPMITAYAVDSFYRDLNDLPADNIFVFIDACFSGRLGRDEEERLLLTGVRPGILKVKDPLLMSEKIVVMSAAETDQVSNYYRSKGYGLFTYYLISGLTGDADTDGDGRVRLGELVDFVREGVSQSSRRMFGLARHQTPVVMPPSLGSKEGLVIVEIE